MLWDLIGPASTHHDERKSQRSPAPTKSSLQSKMPRAHARQPWKWRGAAVAGESSFGGRSLPVNVLGSGSEEPLWVDRPVPVLV